MNYDLTNLPHNIEHHHTVLEDKQHSDTTSAGVYKNNIETNVISETGRGMEIRGSEILVMNHEISAAGRISWKTSQTSKKVPSYE